MNNRIVFGTFWFFQSSGKRYYSKFASWIWLQDNNLRRFVSIETPGDKKPPVRRDVKSCSTFFHRNSDANSTRRRHALYVSSKNPVSSGTLIRGIVFAAERIVRQNHNTFCRASCSIASRPACTWDRRWICNSVLYTRLYPKHLRYGTPRDSTRCRLRETARRRNRLERRFLKIGPVDINFHWRCTDRYN